VLAVAHFNHGLRGADSDADQAFVADLARQFGLEFFAGLADVRDHAILNKLSVEAAARELRYQWFARLAAAKRLDAIATAHTLDDQAETVLLKFLRGAGTRGLAGIYPELSRDHDQPMRIARPLLCVTRDEIEAYLESLGQNWREDTSNLDRRFLRNRVRHELLPLLEREYNPNIRQALSDLADLSRSEEQYWQEQVETELRARAGAESLNIENFRQLPLALQRRLLKCFAEEQGAALDFEHVEKLRRCALGELTRTELPGGRIVVNTKGSLEFKSCLQSAAAAYDAVLPIPGEIYMPGAALMLRATIVPEAFGREMPPGELLSYDLLGSELKIRNWRPGDRFWPAHSRSEEKLKRLFSEKNIPAEQRATWPVALRNDDIVWVRGFPVAAAYRWQGKGQAVKIEAIADQK
jgi:tRNA(Ile)-lysidine synthase